MTQLSQRSSLHSSRLVRLLTRQGPSEGEISHQDFALGLAQLVDLPDSIGISSAHGRVAAADSEPCSDSSDRVREQFLRVRESMIRTVVRSFARAPGYTRIKLPPLSDEPGADPEQALGPYLRFYAAQQRQIDFTAQNLHTDIRESAARLSPAMAQLVALDRALGGILSGHSRQFFGVVPDRLGHRYCERFTEYRQAAAGEAAWLESWQQLAAQLCDEMQDLLLAEIETRLLPVLGLVEATNENAE